MKKDSIMLTAAQRRSLEQVISRGKSSAWTITHAQVLLKVDRSPLGLGWSTSQIIEAFSSAGVRWSVSASAFASKDSMEPSCAVPNLLDPRNANWMEKPKRTW